MIGAEPTWLPFPDADYTDGRDADLVWSAIARTIGDASAVLAPGFPLTNDDHGWLNGLILQRTSRWDRIGLYIEQPYRYAAHIWRPPAKVSTAFAREIAPLVWTHPAAGIGDRRKKRRAILAYRSQLPLLGFTQHRSRKLARMLRYEALHRGEAIAWLSGR
jgi:hypothetical protein